MLPTGRFTQHNATKWKAYTSYLLKVLRTASLKARNLQDWLLKEADKKDLSQSSLGLSLFI